MALRNMLGPKSKEATAYCRKIRKEERNAYSTPYVVIPGKKSKWRL